MSVWGWVITGYVIVLGTMGTYAWRTLARGRALAKRLPDEDKPWV
jgi:hypothetical protein